MTRRLLVLVLAALALLPSCGGALHGASSSVAVEVDGVELSQSDLEDILATWAGSAHADDQATAERAQFIAAALQYQGPIFSEAGNGTSYDRGFVNAVIVDQVRQLQVKAAVNERHLEIDPAQVDTLLEQISQLAPKKDPMSRPFLVALARYFTGGQLLSQQLGSEQAIQAFITEADKSVSIDPRYGTWSPGSGITPPEGALHPGADPNADPSAAPPP